MTVLNTSTNKVMRVDWKATLLALKIGQSTTFKRTEITVSNLRSKCSRLRREGFVFVVKSINNEDAAIVTREK